MRVLITGGAGFIGSHLVDAAAGAGHEITILDNLDPQVHGGASEPELIQSHVATGGVRFFKGDIADPSAVEHILPHTDAVVHLAAAVGVGQSMYQPYHYVHTNGDGTGALLEAIIRCKQRPQKLIVASSMSLYGEGAYHCPQCGGSGAQDRTQEQLEAHGWEVLCTGCSSPLEPIPTPEEKSPALTSIYAATKKHQEDLCLCFGKAYGLTTFALRFFNVFGSRQSLNNPYTGVAAIFLSRLLNGRAPVIFEDGLQTRDFIDVRDIVNCLLLALEFDGGGAHALNVGTGRPTSVRRMADLLAEALGEKLEPQMLHQYRVGDIRHCVANPDRVRSLLGFRPAYTLETGLPDLIEWCRGRPAADRLEEGLRELRQSDLVR